MIDDNFEHLLADIADLSGLGIASRFGGLSVLLLGETNSEDTKGISISSSNVNVCLDQRLPLADKRAKLVTGHVHAVEIGENIVALNIFRNKADFSVS